MINPLFIKAGMALLLAAGVGLSVLDNKNRQSKNVTPEEPKGTPLPNAEELRTKREPDKVEEVTPEEPAEEPENNEGNEENA